MWQKLEHNMNIGRLAFLESMTKAILQSLRRQSSSMAFRNPVMDQYECREAVAASIAILRQAQADCLDREITSAEIGEAIDFLIERNNRVKFWCERFRAGVLEPDQGIRFEQTDQAYQMIARQFGFE